MYNLSKDSVVELLSLLKGVKKILIAMFALPLPKKQRKDLNRCIDIIEKYEAEFERWLENA